MAHLLRVVGLLLCLLASSLAHALVPPGPLWSYNSSSFNSNAIYPSADAACSAYLAVRDASTPSEWVWSLKSLVMTSAVKGNCTLTVVNPSGPQDEVGTVNAQGGAGTCPANSTAVTGGCQCNSGYVESGSQCVPDPNQACKTKAGSVYREGSTRPLGYGSTMPAAGIAALMGGVPSCDGGCAVAGAGLRAERGLDKNTWTLIVPLLVYSGGTCTGTNKDLEINSKWDTDKQNDAEPTSCAAGKCPGTVNGVSVCMPCSASATSSGTTTQTGGTTATTGGANGDGTGGSEGGGTGTGPTVIGGSGPASSSDIKITVCDGTKCTTTTTSTGTAGAGTGTGAAGGGGGGTSTTDCAKAAASSASAPSGAATCTNTTTTTQPQADFCKENPKNASCSNDPGQSSFSGTCAAGFVATGDDAVLNALAKEQFQQNCKLNPADAETQLAAAERVKTGDQTLHNPANSTVSLGPSNFDTSDALNAGSACPADRNVSLWFGQSFTLRMSSVCQPLEMLGAVMLAFSFLLGARIVARG